VTDDNPSLLALREARARLVERLGQQLAGALEGAREAERGYRNLVADYERAIAEWPVEERGTINTAVAGLRRRLGESLAAQAASVGEQLSARTEERGGVEKRLAQLPAKELAVAEPLRERETRSRIVAFLMESLQEAQITAASTSAGAVLIDPAVPPLARSSPKATLFVLAGALLGVLLGGVVALVRESLRGALHSEAEVERVTGLPVLGVVPDYLHGRTRVKGVRRGQRFLPMRDDPDGPQAEAYRSVRAALRLALDGEERLRTLAVTSCVPGEGKTVTNADLALVFAAAGRRVLFVDSDLREPQVHALFGLPREPGFGDVLEGRADWRACVHTVAAHGLSVLPAGKCTRPPGELLAAQEVLGLLDEMTADHDLVVFDLPPAIVVADVASFAHKLDALLLVYRAGGVPARLLAGAITRLQQSDVNLLGVLLNAVYVGRGPVGYGYGYGQGYGRSGRGKSSPS